MSKSHKGIIFSFIIILSISGILRFQYVRSFNNIERITYRSRTYIKSINQTMNADLKKCFDETKSTGIYEKGMEVYDVENNPFASTVIFLKTKDESFLVYSLSGGP